MKRNVPGTKPTISFFLLPRKNIKGKLKKTSSENMKIVSKSKESEKNELTVITENF